MLYAYRTSEQATTRDTPFGTLYGREARLNEIDNFNYGYEPSEFVKNLHFRWQTNRSQLTKSGCLTSKAHLVWSNYRNRAFLSIEYNYRLN
jgi:hypothetical protein